MLNKTTTKTNSDEGHDLSLAVTALMIEIMHSDDVLDDAERDKINKSLEKRYELSSHEVQELVLKAQEATAKATDFHQFTSRIKDHYPVEDRISILTDLWGVAMADGHIDTHEEHLIRRIANLIGVYHDEFIHAKIQARKEN